MSNQTILIATLTPPSKVVDFSGSTVIAVRETIDLRIYGAGTASAASLIVGLKRNGTICAITDGMTDQGTYYDCELDLNTEEMVDAMDGLSGTMTRRFEFFVWDSTNEDLLANGSIAVQWNPYSDELEEPSPIDDIGEVFTSAEKTKLAGIEEGADGTLITEATADVTLTEEANSHQIVIADTTDGSVEVTLPSAAVDIKTLRIIKAAAANTLTITPAGAETINGQSGSQTVNAAYAQFMLIPYDGNWLCAISANP